MIVIWVVEPLWLSPRSAAARPHGGADPQARVLPRPGGHHALPLPTLGSPPKKNRQPEEGAETPLGPPSSASRRWHLPAEKAHGTQLPPP